MKHGLRFSLGGLFVVAVVAALGGAGIARGEVVTSGEQCNPDGRTICLTVSTDQNVTASDPSKPTSGKRFTYVEWTIKNNGGSQLTHPTVTVAFEDLCDFTDNNVKDEVQCTDPPSSTAAFQTPASPNACQLSGEKLVCTYSNLAAGQSAQTTRIFFKTADRTAALPVTSSDIVVTGSAKEGGHDANQCNPGTDPNCDTFAVTRNNSYEPLPNAALTYAVNGNRFHLADNAELSSFDFTASKPTPFLTKFETLPASTTYCFGDDVPCFDRTLHVDSGGNLSYNVGGNVVFYARLINPPNTVDDKKLDAIHTYDPITFTASNNRLTPGSSPSFARMDGLRLDAAAFGLQPGKYFVLPTTYTSSNNSFRISATKGGTPLTLTNGTGSASPVRIIGDQDDERSSPEGCQLTTAPSKIPSICAKKVAPGSKDLDSFVWDSGNGWIQH